MSRSAAKHVFRTGLMVTISALALAVAAPAVAQTVSTASLKSTADPASGNIDPFAGDISALWGDINPFYGNIDPFWGDINPFSGNIAPFYGDINPFWGDINPFYGDINPFNGTAPALSTVGQYWKDAGPVWTQVSQKWAALGPYTTGTASYQALAATLKDVIARSETVWGKAVTARTGKSFRAGFADALLAKYGIKLDDPATLQGITAAQRSHMILDWYDGLMNYAGVDHVDWWMRAVNWTPSITQIQGSGTGTVVGLLDATVTGDKDIASNLTYTSGYVNSLDGHGTSVASLMVADHDGKGVMGIAPRASVVAYNPFDQSGTASFEDVRKGIIALKGAGATVINMSLGVPGWTLAPDWKGVFQGSSMQPILTNTVFVLAAGNSGVSQTTNVSWDWSDDPALIVVGSVSPTGQISSFSDRPGMACLLDNGNCYEKNRLYDRFIVAPGELMLVSDGQGGLERRSGTSFSAPLVTGAITLLHDRWPWLAKYPHETVDIILHSAHDLGAPGPDAVYGWGLLDVAASQSPLDFSKLSFYEVRNGLVTQRSVQDLRAGGVKGSWEADGVSFTLYEKIGDTIRDFQVPMSNRLVGQSTLTKNGFQQYQTYIRSRLTGWIAGTNGFSNVVTGEIQQPGQWAFAATTSLPEPDLSRRHEIAQQPNVSVRMTDPTGRFAISAGHGEGAMALGQVAGFGFTRDYGGADAGVNPMLGLASGGAFAAVDVGLTRSTTLTLGTTERRLDHEQDPLLDDLQRNTLRNLDDYEAGAISLRLSQRLTSQLTVSAAWSSVREANGLLGVQSMEASDLRHGSRSNVADMSVSWRLPHGLLIAGSASAGRSRSVGGDDQAFATLGDVRTSAYAVSLTKRGLVGGQDMLRLTLSQPMYIDRGTLSYTSVEVVDRSTGEIGVVARPFDIG